MYGGFPYGGGWYGCGPFGGPTDQGMFGGGTTVGAWLAGNNHANDMLVLTDKLTQDRVRDLLKQKQQEKIP